MIKQLRHGTGGQMTNKEASEWFKKRAQEAPMPGAREAFKLAAEALANADVPDNNVGDLISRQAVIDLWEKYHPTIAVDAMWYDAELRQLPSAQPEQCEDAVSREKINKFCHEVIKRDPDGDNDVVKAFVAFRAYVNSLPPVTPKQRTGKWIDDKDKPTDVIRVVRCKNCEKAELSTIGLDTYLWCKRYHERKDPDFYCGDGRRTE